MRPEDVESRLWELSEQEDPAEEERPGEEEHISDGQLLAYRNRQLSAAQRRRTESALVAVPRLRRRLVQLAELSQASPEPAVRQELLRRFTRNRTTRWGWLAAAVLLTAGGLSLWSPWVSDSKLPDYELSFQGLHEQRQEQDGSRSAVAYPDTVVVFRAEAVEASSAAVELGLYLARDEGLSRIPEHASVERVIRNGALLLRAPARALVGTRAGTYNLYFVASSEGPLPELLTMPPSEAELVHIAGRRLQRLTLHLRLPAEPERDESQLEGAGEQPSTGTSTGTSKETRDAEDTQAAAEIE